MTALANPNKPMISTGKLLAETWKIYKQNYRLLLGYTAWLLVPFVVHLLISITFGQSIVELSYIITTIIEMIMMLWLSVLIINLTPVLKNKKRKALKKISKESWKLVIPYFLISIITYSIVLTGIALFMIPGIIIFAWFLFAQIIVVLEQLPIRQSIKESWRLVKGRSLLILGKYLLGEITLCAIFVFILLGIYMILGPLQGLNFDMIINAPPTVMGQAIEYILILVFIPAILIFKTLLYLNAKETRQLILNK